MPEMPTTLDSPVIAIDGPSGSGKGTIAQLLANRLHWHYLESGALYRVLGFLAHRDGVATDDVPGLVALAGRLDLSFQHGAILLGGVVIDEQIRTEQAGDLASRLALLPKVRTRLLGWQRQRAQPPGLVADGRDMGTVVFADAPCKIFLTANAESRAKRRFIQLKKKGFAVTIEQLVQDIQQRDQRDMKRSVSPLKVASDAFELDTTELSIDEVLSVVFAQVKKSGAIG